MRFNTRHVKEIITILTYARLELGTIGALRQSAYRRRSCIFQLQVDNISGQQEDKLLYIMSILKKQIGSQADHLNLPFFLQDTDITQVIL